MPPATATKAKPAKSTPAKAEKNGKVAKSPAKLDPAHAAVRAAADQLKFAADPSRLSILLMLAGEELNVGQICSRLDQTQPAASHHLAILRHARLVERRRTGKNNYYSLSNSGHRLVEAVCSLV